jgi:hypothetical protein
MVTALFRRQGLIFGLLDRRVGGPQNTGKPTRPCHRRFRLCRHDGLFQAIEPPRGLVARGLRNRIKDGGLVHAAEKALGSRRPVCAMLRLIVSASWSAWAIRCLFTASAVRLWMASNESAAHTAIRSNSSDSGSAVMVAQSAPGRLGSVSSHCCTRRRSLSSSAQWLCAKTGT